MKRPPFFLIAALMLGLVFSGCAAFTPAARKPHPADFSHLWTQETEGKLTGLNVAPKNIYGLGLTYAAHLRETGSSFDPDKPPPVFKKALVTLNKSEEPVKIPDRKALLVACERLEPGLSKKVDKKFKRLPTLLDYEGELAFVLLEDVDWEKLDEADYSFKIGYFLVNDLSARTLAVLGEGQGNRYDYWEVSKSFPGFLPVGSKMWVPSSERPDSLLSITLMTKVNGKLRQKESTTDMMYTPRQMLCFISETYPDDLPRKGDIVLMGTPGGVALQVPAWKSWLADLFHVDRFGRLSSVINSSGEKFLKPGDIVEVSGGMLGELKTEIT